MADDALPVVDARVMVKFDGDQVPGVIRFVGEASFASGPVVGVELDDALGKNDGSVRGERYFSCPPQHGMFVRPTAVSPIDRNMSFPRQAEGYRDSQTRADYFETIEVEGAAEAMASPRNALQNEESGASQKVSENEETAITLPTTKTIRKEPEPDERGLSIFWEAIGGRITQDDINRAENWFEEQGADTIDDIVRYKLASSFTDCLQLKLVQQRKATEFWQFVTKEAEAVGRSDTTRSPTRGLGGAGVKSADARAVKRSAEFTQMLGPVLAPHGYTQDRIRDVVREYEEEVAPVLQKESLGPVGIAADSAASLRLSLPKINDSNKDWLDVLVNIHASLTELAASASAAEVQAIAASKTAAESESVAAKLTAQLSERREGPTEQWITGLTERLDRAESSVQKSAQAAQNSFGQFHQRVEDVVREELFRGTF